MKLALPINLNTVIECQADGKYLAHCLQLDLVAYGNSPETAASELLEVIDIQFRTCLQNDNVSHFYHPAPQEAWARLGTLLIDPSSITSESTRTVSTSAATYDIRQFCYYA